MIPDVKVNKFSTPSLVFVSLTRQMHFLHAVVLQTKKLLPFTMVGMMQKVLIFHFLNLK